MALTENNNTLAVPPMVPQYFECACFSPEHTLRFAWDDEDQTIYTTVFLNQYHNIFARMWIALRYVFGHTCRYGHFDCFIMQPEDASRLKRMLEKIEAPKGSEENNGKDTRLN